MVQEKSGFPWYFQYRYLLSRKILFQSINFQAVKDAILTKISFFGKKTVKKVYFLGIKVSLPHGRTGKRGCCGCRLRGERNHDEKCLLKFQIPLALRPAGFSLSGKRITGTGAFRFVRECRNCLARNTASSSDGRPGAGRYPGCLCRGDGHGQQDFLSASEDCCSSDYSFE